MQNREAAVIATEIVLRLTAVITFLSAKNPNNNLNKEIVIKIIKTMNYYCLFNLPDWNINDTLKLKID